MNLLTVGNTKTLKGEKKGWMSFIMHLAPADLSGREVCPKRTKGCTEACLNSAGRGKMHATQRGRLRKTKWYHEDRDGFMCQLIKDIRAAERRAAKRGLLVCIRLNGTSDIPWERVRYEGKNIFEWFPHIQFYDYTKMLNRKVAAYPNYHLTFSRAESNEKDVAKAVAQGMNIAVVFDVLPKKYMGLRVVSGDDTDLRFKDPKNVVVGLTAKGRGKKDTSGFVVRAA